ncbi:hypothetical protein BKA70DRAFT_1188665 [Coprinopsis sp. MPI-PUGE-AT-0042]|nr:hypothetical protein BKA70DRAFT_1188665 [Coprinopsis sp. MPI-PUGE-AT-0042]
MIGTVTRHFARSARRTVLTRPVSQARLLHVTSPVMKKKRGAATEMEDMFEEFEIVDESIKAKPEPTPSAPTATSALASEGKRKLMPQERQAQFSEIMGFVKPRLGRKPEITGNYARDASWLRLLQLATTKEQLQEVVDLMPLWKESGRKFNSTFSAAFVRRCKELGAQPLALQVFGNYAKYNASLDLASGRQLLHSRSRAFPIEDVMTASALFNLYGIPPVSQDLVSCSIIVQACLRHNSPHSNAIAEALIPHLRQLKEKTPVDVNDTYHRENVWVAARSLSK